MSIYNSPPVQNLNPKAALKGLQNAKPLGLTQSGAPQGGMINPDGTYTPFGGATDLEKQQEEEAAVTNPATPVKPKSGGGFNEGVYASTGSKPWPTLAGGFSAPMSGALAGGFFGAPSQSYSFTPPPPVDPYDAPFAQEALRSTRSANAAQDMRNRYLQQQLEAALEQQNVQRQQQEANINMTNAQAEQLANQWELMKRRYNTSGPLAGLWNQRFDISGA